MDFKSFENAAKIGYDKSKQVIINAIDQNGNGEIDVEDAIILGLRVPGVKVNRANFLQKELFKNYPQNAIDDAIKYNPAHAGIPPEEIDKIAEEVIKYERYCVSGVSAALGAPGAAYMIATLPADLAQNYGFMLRAAQKLMYLYGFPELDTNEKGQKFDTETINLLIISLGVMYGVAGAGNAIKAAAKALGKGVEKKLLNAALTKGAIYPIVKRVAMWFGIRMNKTIFSSAIGKSIPLVGGAVGGVLTFATFKPCCERLKESLQDTMLSNPHHISTNEEEKIFTEIVESELL